MLTTNEIVSFLRENKSLLRKKFHCMEIGLFGSFARNEQTEESDIDFLVVFEPDIPDLLTVEIDLKNFLEMKFHRSADICTKKWINPIFKHLVLDEAIYA
jgi:uncharacterized protein